ncbi:histone-lysine N-methyltransferase SETDB2 isoform X2 [Rhinatrema bivittatum]|nr:histone-lysine N-methyltransferase SETDB2 isoform X2 [Rhinatrema bivittatum]
MHEAYSEDNCLSTALPAMLPFKKYHICSASCLTERPLGPLSGKNPLKIPIFCQFLRLHAKTSCLSMELDVYYKAPCGRSLRNFQEVQNYLIATQCKFLFVDYFSFNTYLQLNRTGQNQEHIVSDSDISNGAESVPVSFCNEIDSAKLPYFKYRKASWPRGYYINNFSDMFIDSCSCTDGCRDIVKCPCLQLTAGDSSEDSTAVPWGYEYKRLQKPIPSGIFECGMLCKCDKMTCQNRVVQHGLQLRLQVFKTLNKGWGVRCLDDIDKGTFVCTYTGKILSKTVNKEGGSENQAKDALDNDDEDDGTFESVTTLSKKRKTEISCSDSEIEFIHTEEDNSDKGHCKPVLQAVKHGKQPQPLGFQSYGYNPKNLCPPTIRRPKSRTAILQNRRKQLIKKGATTLIHASSEDEDAPVPQQLPKTKFSVTTRRAKKKEIPPEEKVSGTCDEWAISDDESDIDGSICHTSKPKVETEGQTDKAPLYKASEDSSVSRSEAETNFQRSSTNEEHIYLLDATKEGNVGRFLNHSCCPNLFVQNVFVDTHNRSFPWVAFFTNRHIKAGTELTWDYAYEVGSLPENEIPCLCGVQKCRKKII